MNDGKLVRRVVYDDVDVLDALLTDAWVHVVDNIRVNVIGYVGTNVANNVEHNVSANVWVNVRTGSASVRVDVEGELNE